MNVQTGGRAFQFVASAAIATGGVAASGALLGTAPAGAVSPSFTVTSSGPSTSMPTLMTAGGNTPWG